MNWRERAAFFWCFEITKQSDGVDEVSLLMADYSVSCTDWSYNVHFVACIILAIAIPVGVPTILGLKIWRSRKAIAEHKGPHPLENLYEDYKPDW